MTSSMNGILKLKPGSIVLSNAPSLSKIAFSVSLTITMVCEARNINTNVNNSASEPLFIFILLFFN